METPAPQREMPQLVMVRARLDDLPPVQLDAGYHLRPFAPGDEAGWSALVSESFNTPYDFEKTLRPDAAFLPQRVLFVEHNGQTVATASAWRHDAWGPNTGVIHMVAASPQHSGHRLGYQISLGVLHQFAREGVNHAVLQTDDFRLPAVATYLKLGFLPFLVHVNQAVRWEKIYKNLKLL